MINGRGLCGSPIAELARAMKRGFVASLVPLISPHFQQDSEKQCGKFPRYEGNHA
jgi:hypothetical protein